MWEFSASGISVVVMKVLLPSARELSIVEVLKGFWIPLSFLALWLQCVVVTVSRAPLISYGLKEKLVVTEMRNGNNASPPSLWNVCLFLGWLGPGGADENPCQDQPRRLARSAGA